VCGRTWRLPSISDVCSQKVVHRSLLVSPIIDAILEEVAFFQSVKKHEQMTSGNGLSDVYMATLIRLRALK